MLVEAYGLAALLVLHVLSAFILYFTFHILELARGLSKEGGLAEPNGERRLCLEMVQKGTSSPKHVILTGNDEVWGRGAKASSSCSTAWLPLPGSQGD